MLLKIAIITCLGLLAVYLVNSKFSRKWIKPEEKFPKAWKKLLYKNVSFYKKLPNKKKKLFEYKVLEFINNVTVKGVQTTINDLDRLLVGASAVIPIFAFPEWKYKNLDEVLIYPSTFSQNFETTGKNRNVLGMVGTGFMDRKMILSKNALRKGFANETDKRNTAIHEFIHLIDKMDGKIDGIPRILLEKQYTIPWIDMIEQKIEEIVKKQSDINPYAGTSQIEFLTVLGEYFFERPLLLKKNHPKLYEMLEEIFDQDLDGNKIIANHNNE